MKIIALIIILLLAFVVYLDYRKYSANTQEVIKDYPYVENKILYTDGFEIELSKITKIQFVDNGGIPYYFIEYRITENKRGGLLISIFDFRKIEKELIR